MQKTDQFIINGMAVQVTEIRDTELLTAEMFARQISGLSAHGTHSAYSRTPAGATAEECEKQSSSGAPSTSIVFFFLLWKTMVPSNRLVTNLFCVRQNKEIHTGLERLEGE